MKFYITICDNFTRQLCSLTTVSELRMLFHWQFQQSLRQQSRTTRLDWETQSQWTVFLKVTDRCPSLGASTTPTLTGSTTPGLCESVSFQHSIGVINYLRALGHIKTAPPPQKKITRLIPDSDNLITGSYHVKTAKLHVIKQQRNSEITKKLEGHSVERMYLRQRCFNGSLAQ